jgi:inhibitor of KinA
MNVQRSTPFYLGDEIEVNPLGDGALLLRWSDHLDVDGQIDAFCAALRANPFAGMVDVVPAFRTVGVYYDVSLCSVQSDVLQYVYRNLLERYHRIFHYYNASERKIEIPICYEFGIDIDELCRLHKISAHEWMRIHRSATYRVRMIGFAPGFPYMTGLPAKLHAPRRTEPRTWVPAGSVAIGGSQCGIYPQESPGGWHIIGRTPLRLFDPDAPDPARLQAGDLVTFVPISYEQFHEESYA